ncbi:MAG TPA: hypothetical protein VN323_02215 [Candidatus Dormibacteraeota bacterium]|jgi:hypothetical protein|nr:hypothetical protein [Candidatus Dormibacteraeota bacterium]
MAEFPLDALARRLDRLERQTRHWKTAAAILAALLGTAGALGVAAPAPADLQARSVTILDRTGAPRIRMAVADNDVTQIELWAARRRSAPTLYAAATGGTVQVDGSSPGTAAVLSAGAAASLSLHTRTGNASMSIVQETDRPDPRLPGTSQLVERASLALDRGVARLMLNDSAGTARSVLGDTGLRLVAPDVTEGRPAPSVVLFDESGTVLWKAP